MMISRIDHISLAVRDIEKAAEFFRTVLGAVPVIGSVDPRLTFFWQIHLLGDLSRLELISPTGRGSFLNKFLASREGGVHHINLQTPDIREARRILEAHQIPYFGFYEYPGGEWKELFIHPRDAFGVLIQIAEFNPEDFIPEKHRFPEGKRWQVEKEGDRVRLTLAHPGGGKVTLALTLEEADCLLEDLRAVR